jgi:hypothetical protein
LKSKPYIGHVTEKDRSEGRTSQKKKKERKKRTERAGEERERERKKGHYQENK